MLNFKFSKGAQVSIFIIIGFILIIVSSFLFYNGDYEIFVSHDSKLKNQISDVVEECLESSAKEGVFLLGFQGGRINISGPKYLDPNNYVDFGFKIPNWDSESNDIPTINFMEAELDKYILDNADLCIRSNLMSMKEYFDIEITSDLNVSSKINSENVIVEANLPIKFNEKNSDIKLSVEDYYINLENIRLGSLYKLAVEIFNLEARTNFLEKLVLDQIYSASDYSHPSYSMPTEGMVFSCAPSYWTIPQLKRILSNLNNNNFKYLYFQGTKSKDNLFKTNLNDNYSNFDYKDYYKNFYTFRLDNYDSSFKNFGVDVVMPSTQITGKDGFLNSYPFREFEVTPSSGMIVKPQELSISSGGFGKIPIPCIQIYHNLYTLDYDLVFTLRDYNEDGKNYFFQIPIRIKIEDNSPKKSNSIIFGETPTATNEKFCSNQSRKYEIPVFITDKNTGDTLIGVNITYECVGLTCDLGTTKIPETLYNAQSSAKLVAKFPFCSGGSIIARKEGYAEASFRPDKDPYEFSNDSIAYYEFSLIPTKKFKLSKYTFYSYIMQTRKGHRIYDSSNETIYVSIENRGNNFESFAIYPSDIERFSELEFLRGDYRYNVSIIYVDKDNNLKGIYEKENVLLNPDNGNNLRIVFPSSSSIIDDNNFMDFYNYMQSILDSEVFGISFK